MSGVQVPSLRPETPHFREAQIKNNKEELKDNNFGYSLFVILYSLLFLSGGLAQQVRALA